MDVGGGSHPTLPPPPPPPPPRRPPLPPPPPPLACKEEGGACKEEGGVADVADADGTRTHTVTAPDGRQIHRVMAPALECRKQGKKRTHTETVADGRQIHRVRAPALASTDPVPKALRSAANPYGVTLLPGDKVWCYKQKACKEEAAEEEAAEEEAAEEESAIGKRQLRLIWHAKKDAAKEDAAEEEAAEEDSAIEKRQLSKRHAKQDAAKKGPYSRASSPTEQPVPSTPMSSTIEGASPVEEIEWPQHGKDSSSYSTWLSSTSSGQSDDTDPQCDDTRRRQGSK